MQPVFVKLNWKAPAPLVILNAPASFEPEIAALDGAMVVRSAAAAKAIEFLLAFVTRQSEVDKLAAAIGKKAAGDAVVWFAYPKGSSKNYKSEINRDSGWKPMGDAGFEPVRMVAIDEDWSAVRFRRTEFIKTMTRGKEHRMSAAGKQRG